MPHLFKSTYRARNTVRFRAERANKPRSQRIRRAVHDYRPSRLAKLVQRRLQRNRRLFLNEYGNLYNRLRDRFRRYPFCYTLARPLRAAAYCCPASCCTAASCRSHRFHSSFAVCLSRECSPSTTRTLFSAGFVSTNPETRYFRRSTMCLSVRLLCRVFLPNVGNAHGVCG